MSRKEKAQEFVDEGYNISITGRNVLVTEAMKNYAMEKITKIERFSNRIIDVFVTMDIIRNEHRVEIILKVNDIKIFSQASTDDMYASIDKAVDKILAQLRRYKNKLQDHQARGHKGIEMNVNVLNRGEEDEESSFEHETDHERELYERYRPHQVVKTEKRHLRNLRHDEAIMKMELSGDAFLLYRGEEDLKLKLLYRRNDGNFAIIEVET